MQKFCNYSEVIFFCKYLKEYYTIKSMDKEEKLRIKLRELSKDDLIDIILLQRKQLEEIPKLQNQINLLTARVKELEEQIAKNSNSRYPRADARGTLRGRSPRL
jgi:hypothetical protein